MKVLTCGQVAVCKNHKDGLLQKTTSHSVAFLLHCQTPPSHLLQFSVGCSAWHLDQHGTKQDSRQQTSHLRLMWYLCAANALEHSSLQKRFRLRHSLVTLLPAGLISLGFAYVPVLKPVLLCCCSYPFLKRKERPISSWFISNLLKCYYWKYL